jgi:hypothetical protein
LKFLASDTAGGRSVLAEEPESDTFIQRHIRTAKENIGHSRQVLGQTRHRANSARISRGTIFIEELIKPAGKFM